MEFFKEQSQHSVKSSAELVFHIRRRCFLEKEFLYLLTEVEPPWLLACCSESVSLVEERVVFESLTKTA